MVPELQQSNHEYKALIVEDDEIDHICIARTIGKDQQPFVSDRACCIRDVPPLLDKSYYDIIIADMNLPDSNGLKTIDTLLKMATKTPIVVLSGTDDDSIALEAIHAGAQDYIPKRYLGDSEFLKRILRHAIERHQLKMGLEAVRDRERFLAHFDQCTALPNRSLFMDRLDRSVLQAQRDKTRVSLLFIDLDRFKSVNDTLGHGAGDVVLKTIGRRITQLLRESDTTARFGGDEFVVILNNVADDDSIAVLAKKIIRLVNQPIAYEHHFCYVGASIGVASYPEDAENAEQLLVYADMAMYTSKRSGRNQVHFFDRDMLNQKRLVVKIESELKKAIECPERHFELYYQPLVDLKTGEIHSVEALIRWRFLSEVDVTTEQFVRFAEELGMISEIDRWVLETACQQAAYWRNGYCDTRISVNISSKSINQSDFVSAVVEPLLNKYNLPGSCIEMEITERVLLEDTFQVREQLSALRALGIIISVDDFGTGFSSLNYLNSFPINTLKIDGCFVCDESSSPKDQALLKAIVSLGKTLGLRVVAECIETQSQMIFLKRLGCDYGQGYFWGRPSNQWRPKMKDAMSL